MSLSRKGSKNPLYGKKHSEETKELMKNSKIGWLRPKLSTNTKNTISSALGHKTYLYKLLDTEKTILSKMEIENTTFKVEKNKEIYNDKNEKFLLVNKFNSLREVGKYLGISHSNVSLYLKSGKLYKRIYKISKTPLSEE